MKKFLYTLVFFCIMPGFFAGALAENVTDYEAIVALVNNAESEQELVNVLTENIDILNLSDADEKDIDYVAYRTSKQIPYLNYEDLCVDIEQWKVLSKINNSANLGELQAIIEKYCYVLNINMNRYNSVPNRDRIFRELFSKTPYDSLYMFKMIFDNALASSNSSSSGGRNSGKFYLYLLDEKGEKFTQPPQEGELIKVTLRAIYNGEQSIVYIAAVYDSDNRMKKIEVMHPNTTERYASEFFEFYTKYTNRGYVKLFAFDSLEHLTPVIKADYFDLDYSEEIPEPEQETDGIIAVKGEITDIYEDYFVLRCEERRAFGYWNLMESEEEIKIYNSKVRKDFYDYETIYYLSISDDKYILEGTSLNDTLIDFSASDIVSYDSGEVVILKDNIEYSYTFSEECQFILYGFDDTTGDFDAVMNNGHHYVLQLIDGNIAVVSGEEYFADRVKDIGGGYVFTDSGKYISTDCVVGKMPDIGDVILFYSIYSEKAKVIEGVKGIYCRCEVIEDTFVHYYPGINIDGTIYEIYEGDKDYYGFEGESYIAYFDPYNQRILYFDRDWENISHAFVTDIDENKLYTTDGEIQLTQDVIYYHGYDQQIVAGSEIKNMIALYKAIYYSYVNDVLKIETIDCAENRKILKYSMLANSFGEYILDEKTQVYADTRMGIFKNPMLEHNSRYEVDIYTDEQDLPIYVIVHDRDGNTFSTEKYMMVTNNSNGYVSGYIDGKAVTIEYNINALPCDLIIVRYLNDEVISVSRIFSPLDRGDLEYSSSDVVYAQVTKIKNKCIVLKGNAYLVGNNTPIYVFNSYNETFSDGNIEDIFYNPGYPYTSNWVMIQKDSNDIVKSILIMK